MNVVKIILLAVALVFAILAFLSQGILGLNVVKELALAVGCTAVAVII